MPAKAKISPLFIGLAVVTLGLSSWGLFHLFVDFAHMPGWLAASVIGGLDLAAVAFGKFALTVSADGDSPALWNLLLLLFMALAAYVQYVHAKLAGDPQIIGVTMAAFPVATVLLFEGQLRRVARVNGRAGGVVAAPRRRVPLLVWVHFPVETWRATRATIRAQGHLDPVKDTPIKPARVKPTTATPVRDSKPPVADLVRAARDIHGDVPQAVLAEVEKILPGVSPNTVRTVLRRDRANGYAHVAG